MFGDAKMAKLSYLVRVGGLAGNPGRASQCEGCKECEEACPQKLPVSELMKDVATEMEGRFFDPKVWLFKKVMQFSRWKTLRNAPK